MKEIKGVSGRRRDDVWVVIHGLLQHYMVGLSCLLISHGLVFGRDKLYLLFFYISLFPKGPSKNSGGIRRRSNQTGVPERG